MNDYYKILGLKPGADTESIHKAFRNLAKTYHPDLNDSTQANEFFILLNEAHEVLTDEARRIIYDQQYLVWKKSNAPQNFHYDWESISQMRNRPKSRVNPPGQIMQMVFGLEMFIGFTEALLVLGYIFIGPIHPVYGVFAIPGALMVIDGWKGIVARKSVLGGIVKAFKKMI